jgi:hypothetical protein
VLCHCRRYALTDEMQIRGCVCWEETAACCTCAVSHGCDALVQSDALPIDDPHVVRGHMVSV